MNILSEGTVAVRDEPTLSSVALLRRLGSSARIFTRADGVAPFFRIREGMHQSRLRYYMAGQYIHALDLCSTIQDSLAGAYIKAMSPNQAV